MNLYEFQAKKLLLKFKLPILKNWICSNVSEINNCLYKINDGPPWVVKCQIRAGSRGKSGGVQFVSSKEEISLFAKKWIGNPLITNQTTGAGEIVDSILIEPAVKILNELYLSILIDRDSSQIIFMTSTKGGMDIENLLSKNSIFLNKSIIDPIYFKPNPYEGRIIASKLGLKGIYINQFVQIYLNIIQMFIEKDLMLIEINPLVMTSNSLICLDAKVTIDNNALFRQSDLLDLYLETNKTDSITTTGISTMNYVSLDGNIGCMVNGAGLAMATMDLMQLLGGSPANFLDIGGDTSQADIVSALSILIKNTKIKAIFINIFGGIVCCNLIANSIIIALSEYNTNIPIVVRLEGNNSKLGTHTLINSSFNIIVINNVLHAIQKIITLVN